MTNSPSSGDGAETVTTEPDDALAVFAAAFADGRPPRMSERELVDAVLGECRRLKLKRVYRTPRSDKGGIRAGGRGFPDLMVVGLNGAIFRECKSADGETTAEQDDWAWHLHHNGLNWAIWRPADWESGRIQAELRALADG